TLALTHTNFGRLLGNRHIRENPDPHTALALHLAGDRAASRFDLASGDARGFGRLQGILAESQLGTAPGNAMDTALLSRPVLGLLRSQHNDLSCLCAFAIPITAIRAGTTFTPFLALATVVTFGRTTLVCSGLVLEHFALAHPS